MKAITLIQPWATLLVLRIKQHETRSWPTKFRGWLLVHASNKKWDDDGLWLWDELYQRNVLTEREGAFKDLPRGAIIGKVFVENCVPAQRVVPTLEDTDYLCGDFSEGRFAWWMTDAEQFARPIPAKGALGLWDFKGEVPS